MTAERKFDNVILNLEKPIIKEQKVASYLKNCGSMVDEDAAFCTECGWSFTNQPQIDKSYMTEEDDDITVLLNDCQDTAANESVSEQILPDEIENIRVCKNCGAPLRPQSVFCTNCDKRADVM